jgi:hypothetical protein
MAEFEKKPFLNQVAEDVLTQPKFNYEGFVKDAKKEGYSDQEIQEALASQNPISYHESGRVIPEITPELLALGGKFLYNQISKYGGGNPPSPPPSKPSSIQERTFQRIEPTLNSNNPVTAGIQSTADNVIPIFTPAAQKEISDPVIMNGIRKSQLEGYIGQPLPTDPKLVESIVKGYQNKYGVGQMGTNTDLYSMGNVRPGEHEMGVMLGNTQNVPEPDYTSPAFMRKGQTAPEVNPAGAPQVTPQNTPPVDTNIPGTQNIGQINTKPAVEGGFQVDPTNTPNVAQDVKGLENAALTPEESSKKEILTKIESNIAPTSEVQGGVRPQTIADIQARPELNPSLREHLARQEALLAGNEKYHKTLAREYQTGAKIGPDQVFVPGLGNMDNSMYNTLGAEGRREAMEALKGGQAFGQVKLPGQGFNEQFSKNLEDYSKHLSETIPVDLTTRKSRIAEGLAHTENYKKLGKVGVVGGVTGLIMGLADLANAKTPQEARAARRNIGEGVMPPSMTTTELAPATLTPSILEAQRQATLLGSPYRKSTGIAPPQR